MSDPEPQRVWNRRPVKVQRRNITH